MRDIFNKIDSIGKKPIVAEIGGFRPEPNIKSWFGGNFFIDNQNGWPKDKDGSMVPIIQIKVSEVPDGISHFGEAEIVQVFINKERLPSRIMAQNGEGWLLREYKTLDGLELQKTPEECNLYRIFQIKWHVSPEKDFPCWEEMWEYFDMSEINDDDELSEQFFDEYDSYNNTKIGGYASYIQSPCSNEYKYIFQITSEEKPRFMVGDNGNIYILKSNSDGKWYLYWDCY